MNPFKALLDLILPRRCVICGGRLNVRETYCCLSCAVDMPYTYFWEQPDNKMALSFREKTGNTEVNAASLIFYREGSPYRQVTRHLKYEYGIGSGRYFSKLLAHKLKKEEIFGDVDLVVPVPLHWARRWSRGYNQAEIIAGTIASSLNATMDAGLLERCRHTRTQTRLAGAAKADNVSGAFRLKKDVRSIHPRHIMLVDDVFTSGSTLAECYKVIKKACRPETKISIVTLAFVDK